MLNFRTGLRTLLFVAFCGVWGSVAAQTDSLAVPDSSSMKCCPCRSLAWRQMILPAGLVGSACVVRHFDNDVYDFRNRHFQNYKTHADDVVQLSPALLMYGLRLCGVEGHSKSWGQLVAATGFSTFMTAGLAHGLKGTWGRTRPYERWYHNSFPSGHTFTAFTSATLLHREYGENSVWYSVGGYSIAGLVGVSRVLNNKHWASDVLAGAGFGIVSGNLGYGLANCLFSKPRKGTPSYKNISHSYLGVSLTVSPWSNGIRSLGPANTDVTQDVEFVRFRHKYGGGYTIEGAYFPCKWVGIGAETSVYINKFGIDEGYFHQEANLLHSHFLDFSTKYGYTYQLMPGVHFAYPLTNRFLLGAKVLYGLAQTKSFNVEAVSSNPVTGKVKWGYLNDDFTYGKAFKTGVYGRWLAANYFELNAGVNFAHSTAGYAFDRFQHSTNFVRNIGIQIGAAIPLE